MVLKSTYPVGNVWLCENDWFIRPYGGMWERIKRLPTKKIVWVFISLIVALPGTGFLLYFDANYPDGPLVPKGFEYRCGEQYDRVRCANVPVYAEDRTRLDYPKWVEIFDGYSPLLLLSIIASVFVIIIQGKSLWNWWTWMGGIGPLGNWNHRHCCPECKLVWRDNEPNCPGLVEYECLECWNRAQNRGNAEDRSRNSVPAYDVRAQIWHNRIGNSGMTRLWRLVWGPLEPPHSKLARSRFGRVSLSVWWGFTVVVVILSLLTFVRHQVS